MTPDLVARYLRVLGAPRREPGPEALAELVRAHVQRIPFENVSKLYRMRRGFRGVPPLEEHLDGIERLHLGGTCYANAFHLNDLLSALGYSAWLCGADMSAPDVHVVNVVEMEGRSLLVDVGFGAPFLEPLPLDLASDHVVSLGRERWVLRPRDAEGRSTVDQYRDGRLELAYRVRPVPRHADHFRPSIEHSYREDATFMNAVVVARFFRDRSLVLRNRMLIESRADRSDSRPLRDRDEVAEVAEQAFGIPREVTAVAIEQVRALEPAQE